MSDLWLPAIDGDDRARALYLRHYSSRKKRRRSSRSRLFVKPGEKMVRLTHDCRAVFVWVLQRHRLDNRRGVECALFRNEGPALSSDLIRAADDEADARWPGEPHFTYVDANEIRSSNPGYCFIRAGWERVEWREDGLVVLVRRPR